jgi:hypothetical protein
MASLRSVDSDSATRRVLMRLQAVAMCPFFSVARPIRLVFVLTALVLPATARGEDDSPRAAPAPEHANLQPDKGSAEVARMAAVLDPQVGSARLWYWGWSASSGRS